VTLTAINSMSRIGRAGIAARVRAQGIFRKSGHRFSVRKCDNAKMLERFLCPVCVKPL